ncbi:hypothetical protein [cyanobacterium endosymbiont of Rhopalodia gibberula]|uniref:hypothetical protein n=1 Tax=cyanobacterium endosymbiont of Rhopalodia gibberula TaxID=1763363 RepID=UPI001558DB5A|nr:hypothetical protein [cyanobacterium endosymbiont of Rhopalodia gibberula]
MVKRSGWVSGAWMRFRDNSLKKNYTKPSDRPFPIRANRIGMTRASRLFSN